MIFTRKWMRKAATLLVALSAPFGCVTDPGYEPPVECPDGLSACDRECVDVLDDVNHCGACGQACATDALCVSGECVCGGGLVSCESGCVDVTTDAEHCGDCGVACERDELCSGGRCVASCQSYQAECGRSCVDPVLDARHCGECDEPCGAARACVGGRCACRAGQQECDGRCVDIASDADNCGACGERCTASEVCAGGRCVCPGGMTACEGRCVDLYSAVEHCGACGAACDAGQVCSQGQCQPECGRGLSECEGSCVELGTNEAHCGECDSPCDDTEVCVRGGCRCAPGRELCDDVCVDLDTDQGNCGRCGLNCAAGQNCIAGRCECPGGGELCGTVCVNLDEDPGHCGGCNRQCEDDEVCSEGSCTDECANGAELCGASCADLLASAAHCGDCDLACGGNRTCSDGNCECPEGTSSCGGSCIDTSTSLAHCGQCDNGCANDAVCIKGECESPGECADECPHASGIIRGCQRRFLYGVNYAWEQYAGDFGGIPAWDAPGVSENEEQVNARMADMAAQGVDVVRWWVWPDFRGAGVRFDGSDTPLGLGGTALADLEKALELADLHDLHLMLTLFSFDNFRPSRMSQGNPIPGMKPIATDPGQRVALIDRVVRPFARAVEQSPHRERLIAWDVINEPEWAMIGPSKYCGDDNLPAQQGLEHLSHGEMETFVADVIAGLRAESSALVTVGGAAMNWACAWRFVDVDFYQFHLYDWVDEYYPFDRTPAEYGVVDKPAIIGEFPMTGLNRAGYEELLDYWYDNGWAGALGWAVTDRGFDWSDSKQAVAKIAEEHPCETHF